MNDPPDKRAEVTDEALTQFFDAAENESEYRRVAELRRLQEFHHALWDLTPKTFVTTTIVGINVAVFVIMLASGVHLLSPQSVDLIRWGANDGPKTADGQWWRLLSCTFVHVGVIHILFNMYVLWGVGHFVERLVGNVGFLVLYLVSGLIGSLASVYWNPAVISAGASGAVFGVFGALLGFLLLRRDSIPMHALAQLRGSALTFVIVNLILGVTVPQIDAAAHVGGLACGFVCGLAMSQRLGPQAAAGRRVRNLLVAAGGAALVVVGVLFMPTGHGDFFAQWERFAAVEEEVLGTYNSAVTRLEQGHIEEAELADIVEQKVLPRWRAGTKPFVTLENLSAEHTKIVATMREYAAARQESWQLLVEAIRENDLKKAAQSKQRAADAEKILRALQR